jgi:hypothetical protein
MARTARKVTAAPAVAEVPAIDTDRPFLAVDTDGVHVVIVKRTLPEAPEGGKVDGRLFARYDSHTRVFGASSALTPERWDALHQAAPGSPEWKAANARHNFYGVRALTALARTLAHRHAAELNGGPAVTRPLVEGKITYSVDAGGKGVGGYVLPGTLRLDGTPCDVYVTAHAVLAGDETITVNAEPADRMA